MMTNLMRLFSPRTWKNSPERDRDTDLFWGFAAGEVCTGHLKTSFSPSRYPSPQTSLTLNCSVEICSGTLRSYVKLWDDGSTDSVTFSEWPSDGRVTAWARARIKHLAHFLGRLAYKGLGGADGGRHPYSHISPLCCWVWKGCGPGQQNIKR